MAESTPEQKRQMAVVAGALVAVLATAGVVVGMMAFGGPGGIGGGGVGGDGFTCELSALVRGAPKPQHHRVSYKLACEVSRPLTFEDVTLHAASDDATSATWGRREITTDANYPDARPNRPFRPVGELEIPYTWLADGDGELVVEGYAKGADGSREHFRLGAEFEVVEGRYQ